MVMDVTVNFTISVSNSGTAEVIKVSDPTVVPVNPPSAISFSYTWKVSDIRWGIITFGAKHQVASSLIKGNHLEVHWNGQVWPAKAHNSAKGRIDGLTALIQANRNDFFVGAKMDMYWDPSQNILKIM